MNPSNLNLVDAAAERLYQARDAWDHNHSRQFHTLAASDDQKDHLRRLLASSADATLVAELRAYFNHKRTVGARIKAAEVRPAIRLLMRAG